MFSKVVTANILIMIVTGLIRKFLHLLASYIGALLLFYRG